MPEHVPVKPCSLHRLFALRLISRLRLVGVRCGLRAGGIDDGSFDS